jgi:hypothetical protein
MSDIDSYSSRPEARPIPFWKHPKRAREALTLIMRALQATAKNVRGGTENESELSLDKNRASRIFFVSGEPGSGKSTLYLTLREMLKSGEKIYSEGYPDLKSLGELQGVLTLLDPLNLEVAGDEGENLLAAVLVRIIEVLDNPDADSNAVLSEPCRKAIKELEELATDIGIAWEGNLKARAGELDPDNYSVEVIRTQRARLRVNQRLSKSLNRLAINKCYDCDSKTLFVLPVDDFYLKPDASLQLLRLLRMISIPRLFFLVMGDINTVEALFIEKSLADWTAVAGARLFPPGSERLDQALTRARELRARYLRKLLPPGQRETIEAMDWHEALNFEVDLAANAETLGEVLRNVNLDEPFPQGRASKISLSKGKTDSLLAFLVSPPLPRLTPSEKKRREKIAKAGGPPDTETKPQLDLRNARAAYTAVQILDATPREMMDLASELREVIGKKRNRDKPRNPGNVIANSSTPLLLSSVRDIVNLVREEHSFLNEKQQEILGRVLPTRIYFPEDINFQMERLSLHSASRTWKAFDSDKMWVRNHRSWDLGVTGKADDKQVGEDAVKDPFGKLPPRPAAWFVLLHDLAWKWNQDSVTGNLVEKLCNDLKAKKWKMPPNTEDSGWAVYGNKTKGYEHFPMPELEIIRELDRFLFIWSRGLEWLGKSGELTLNKVVSIWKLAGRTVLLDSYTDLGRGGDDWYGDFAKGGDGWFKTFMGTRSTSFKARFEEFSKKRGKSFSYPNDGSEEIEAWHKKLQAWDNNSILPNQKKTG